MRHVEAGGIGRRIARARKERGLTQEELATRIGVSPRSIQGYEAGSVVPYRRLSQLADVCNRDIGWLLEGDTASEHELVERLMSVVEELAVEAKRVGAVAERLEHLLGAPERQSVADGPDPAAHP
jgi:transcriptional regulator with XRE-family HTH domain